MKKEKNSYKVAIFPLFLFLLGSAFFIIPILSDYYYKVKYQKEMANYSDIVIENKSGKDYTSLWEVANLYNQSLLDKENQFIVSESDKEYINTILNIYGTGMIGYIEIPKIDIYLPIFHGTEEKVLQSGCGLLYGSSVPTGEKSTHSIITAHNGLVKSKLFTDIDKLKIGDIFYLHILDRTLLFEVIESNVVVPEDFSLLYVEEGVVYTTLYTCTPYGVNSHRLLVKGVLKDSEVNL